MTQIPIPNSPSGAPIPDPAPAKSGTPGTAALVLGIVAAFLAIIPNVAGLAIIVAIVGAIIGFRGVLKNRKTKGRAFWGTVLSMIAFLLAVIILASSGGSTEAESAKPDKADAASVTSASPVATETAVSAPTVTKAPTPKKTAAPADKYAGYPASEKAFVTEIDKAATLLAGDVTDLQQSQIIRKRDAALCAAASGNTATDWIGTVNSIGANGEGKAYIEVQISDIANVQTWNNAFSDAVDDTLIPTTAPFFDGMVALKEDDKVTFSAQLLADSDSCLKKANLTETFYGINPNFIAKFTNVAAR